MEVLDSDLAVQVPSLATECLIKLLKKRGATILVEDSDAGLVSWFDLAGSFVALPTTQEAAISGDFGKAGRGGWSRTVYACARINSSTNGSVVTVYVRGREGCFGPPLYSDGTYERQILAALEKEAYQASLGVILPHPIPIASQSKMVSTNIVALTQSRFGSMRTVRENELVERALGIPLSFPAEQVWRAVVDVLCQYDVVATLNTKSRVAVVTKTATIRAQGGAGVTVMDALLVVHVAQDTNGFSRLHIGMLGDFGLRVMPVFIPEKLGAEIVVPPGDLRPDEQAASTVAQYFLQQFNTQLLHRSRWLEKKLY